MVRLDIISDIVCPWCYIGKTLLDRALERHADHPFAIEWHPYQLNPAIPAGGLPYGDFLEARFGAQQKAVELIGAVTKAAAAAGLEIDFTRIAREPNTLDAHRLIHWAGLEGRQAAVVSALFRAHWREGRDIGDAGVLRNIAMAAGLDGDLTARLLASDADRQETLDRIAHSRARGVTSVPTFIIAETHVLSGAQPPELWEQVIAEISRHRAG